jgi:hypothetical protein
MIKNIISIPKGAKESKTIRVQPIRDYPYFLTADKILDKLDKIDAGALRYTCFADFVKNQKWNAALMRDDDGYFWLVQRVGIILHMDIEDFTYIFGEYEIREV